MKCSWQTVPEAICLKWTTTTLSISVTVLFFRPHFGFSTCSVLIMLQCMRHVADSSARMLVFLVVLDGVYRISRCILKKELLPLIPTPAESLSLCAELSFRNAECRNSFSDFSVSNFHSKDNMHVMTVFPYLSIARCCYLPLLAKNVCCCVRVCRTTLHELANTQRNEPT